MSAVDIVTSSLPKNGLNMERFEGMRVALFSDGDHTLFKPNLTQMYDDAADFIENTDFAVKMLVSANPDIGLAKERAEKIGAFFEIPKRVKWMKFGLFSRAIGRAAEISEFDVAVVTGDRFLADVTMAKIALKDAGIPAIGVFVRRPETVAEPPTSIDKLVLCPLTEMGYAAATTMRIDQFIRPRQRGNL